MIRNLLSGMGSCPDEPHAAQQERTIKSVRIPFPIFRGRREEN